MFAAIPSPSTSSIQIGVFELRAYGMTIAIGALLASFVAEPCMSSAGGGGFLLAHTAKGKNLLFDFFCLLALMLGDFFWFKLVSFKSGFSDKLSL